RIEYRFVQTKISFYSALIRYPNNILQKDIGETGILSLQVGYSFAHFKGIHIKKVFIKSLDREIHFDIRYVRKLLLFMGARKYHDAGKKAEADTLHRYD